MIGRSRRTQPATRQAAAGRPAGTTPPGSRMIAPAGAVRARMGAMFDGAGWFVGPAVALFVFALLVVLLELQSPDRVLWTGHRVVGTEQRGIVFYRWHGQNYSLDVPGYGSSKAVSVYLDPGDPSQAMMDTAANRAPVVLLVGVPVAGGVELVAVGLGRGYRHKRRKMRPASYGDGLDPEFVARHLRELRRDDKGVQ